MASGGPFRRSPLRSESKVRSLEVHPPSSAPTRLAALNSQDLLGDDDPVYRGVLQARADGFGGVILAGPPGTSKSWYADRIASKLTGGDTRRIRNTQFHPSYQYEDFVEGYVPEDSGFRSVPKHLLLISDAARQSSAQSRALGDPDQLFVLVIDELSRCDPARVFGEALTYIEQSKRGISFYIASGRETSLATNLVVLATMNTFDRGVDDVDAAFDRRMARIEMEPDPAFVERFLVHAGMAEELRPRVLGFFRWLQRLETRQARIGHTFFIGLKTEDDLRRRWRFQLVHVFRKAFQLNPAGFNEVQAAWDRVFPVTTISEEEGAYQALDATSTSPDLARAAEGSLTDLNPLGTQ
jgi:5-methylcytosine-specific restriction protein B